MIGSERIWLSVVVPVYNEEAVIPEFHARLEEVLSKIATQKERDFEIIYIDDGSEDRSLELLTAFAERSEKVKVVQLLRNFGQHLAILAGMEVVQGEIVVTLDADLQNPPEEIPKLVEKLEEGWDVVGGRRACRADPFWRRIFSFWMNLLIARATGVRLRDYGCMLRAYHHEVVLAMRECREPVTYVPALANSFARRVTEVEVAHAPRSAGQSKYSFLKLLRLYFDLLTGFSLLPIQLIGFSGVLVALVGLFFGIYLFLRRLFIGPEVEGVFTLFAILFIFVGIEILALAVVGEYVGRIYMTVKGRPPYMIRKVFSKDSPESG